MTTETTTRIPFDFHLFNRPVRVVATVRAARKIKALFSVESARSSIDLYAETENNGIHDFCTLSINMLGRVGSKSGLNLPPGPTANIRRGEMGLGPRRPILQPP